MAKLRQSAQRQGSAERSAPDHRANLGTMTAHAPRSGSAVDDQAGCRSGRMASSSVCLRGGKTRENTCATRPSRPLADVSASTRRPARPPLGAVAVLADVLGVPLPAESLVGPLAPADPAEVAFAGGGMAARVAR